MLHGDGAYLEPVHRRFEDTLLSDCWLPGSPELDLSLQPPSPPASVLLGAPVLDLPPRPPSPPSWEPETPPLSPPPSPPHDGYSTPPPEVEPDVPAHVALHGAPEPVPLDYVALCLRALPQRLRRR